MMLAVAGCRGRTQILSPIGETGIQAPRICVAHRSAENRTLEVLIFKLYYT